jgi:hypothetical protein
MWSMVEGALLERRGQSPLRQLRCHLPPQAGEDKRFPAYRSEPGKAPYARPSARSLT